MKPYWTSHINIGVLFAFGVVAVGCTHQPPIVAPSPNLMSNADRGALIREAQHEAHNLRSELAAVKIASAKQAAALQSAQHEAAELRAREKELAIKVEQIQEDLLATQAERDQLRQQSAEFQARSTALPELRQLVADIKAMQTSMNQMVSTMKTLVTDVTQIKQDIVQNRRKLREQTAKMTAFAVTNHQGKSNSANDMKFISVKDGDTLWRISQAHATTVKRLKEINGLDSNLLIVGQQLRVPYKATSQTTQSFQPKPHKKVDQNGEKEPTELPTLQKPADTNEGP